MQKLLRRDVLKYGITGFVGLICTTMSSSKSDANNTNLFVKINTKKNNLNYIADSTTTPEMLGITKRLEIPPKDGWKTLTHYLVDAASTKRNPIHRRIYLHGMDKYGRVHILNRMVSNWPDKLNQHQIRDWYYIKAICEININYNLK